MNMTAKFKSLFLLAAISLFLSGCVTVHSTKQELLYSPDYMAYITKGGSLSLEVMGNPLGNDPAAATRLANAVSLPHWIPTSKLVPINDADRGEGPRLVLVFNPVSPYTNADTICANPKTKTGTAAGVQKVFAALCHSHNNVTRATAQGEFKPGLENPAWIEMLDYLIRETMPIKNEDHDTTDCFTSPCG